MYRILLGAALIVITVTLSAFSAQPAYAPISVELADGNVWAAVLFVLLGVLLVDFAIHSWRIKWKILSVTAAILVPVLALVGFTAPRSQLHLAGFGVLLVVGVIWTIAYAEADAQRAVSILALLLVCAFLALGFILGIAGVYGNSYDLAPLGLFQKGFLLLFGVLAVRRPNQIAEQGAVSDPPPAPSSAETEEE